MVWFWWWQIVCQQFFMEKIVRDFDFIYKCSVHWSHFLGFSDKKVRADETMGLEPFAREPWVAGCAKLIQLIIYACRRLWDSCCAVPCHHIDIHIHIICTLVQNSTRISGTGYCGIDVEIAVKTISTQNRRFKALQWEFFSACEVTIKAALPSFNELSSEKKSTRDVIVYTLGFQSSQVQVFV